MRLLRPGVFIVFDSRGAPRLSSCVSPLSWWCPFCEVRHDVADWAWAGHVVGCMKCGAEGALSGFPLPTIVERSAPWRRR